jgi:endoglucanase
MRIIDIVLGAASVVSVLATPADYKAKDKRAGKFLFTGANEAGGEFGQDTLPGQLGKHYTWPSPSAMDVRKT